MKKTIYGLVVLLFSIFITQPVYANASIGQLIAAGIVDIPTPSLAPPVGSYYNNSYAVLDSNGSVENIVACNSYCSKGTLGVGGERVILQVPGKDFGFWYGPKTTTYDDKTEMFTAIFPEIVEITETVNGVTTIISGRRGVTFFGGNLFFSDGLTPTWHPESEATVSAGNNNISESLPLGNRKTSEEVTNIIIGSELSLLNSKIDTVLSLLTDWLK
jgi:hypothetical protein